MKVIKKSEDYILDKMFVDVLLEKSRLNRSVSELAFKKSVWMYFVFLVLSILGLTLELISMKFFFVLIFMGIGVLVVGSVPYVFIMLNERKRLNLILYNLLNKDKLLDDYNYENYYMYKKRSEKNVD